MQLSENFTLQEMIFSQEAVRKNLNNDPADAIIENLKALCEKVLEPLRAAAKAPIRVTSGYRSPLVNKAIGGAKNSQHQYGQAADIHIDGFTIEQTLQLIATLHLPIDQVIDEFKAWVHVSHVKEGTNRGQYLKARKVNGKTVYSPLHLSH